MANELIGKAAFFAIQRHGNQMYGSRPYHVHLCDAAIVLRRFFDWELLPQEFVDAIWMHDLLEDTDVTYEEICATFGKMTADLVHAVTNEKGGNRKERHAKTYPKIRDTKHAITIKLADRIANLEQTVSHDRFGRPPQKLFEMYAREWDDFQKELRGRCSGEGHIEELMWQYIEEIMAEGNKKLKEYKNHKTFRGQI